MKNHLFLTIILNAFIFTFYSCSDTPDDPNQNEKGLINFSFTEDVSDGRTAVDMVPSSIFISVKDEQGNYKLNLEKLKVVSVGGGYISENVEFNQGNYTVEDFIVLNKEDSAIYITPKIESEFSILVDNPLPVPFKVSLDSTTSVEMDVIPVSGHTADEFGYANFTLNIIDLTTLDSGLVLYYPFNGNTYDFSQYGNHAIDSTEGVYVHGPKGYALSFDGSTDFLKLSDALPASDGLTYSFWVKSGGPTPSENLGVIISKYSFSERNFTISTFGYAENKDRSRISAHFYTGPSGTNQDWIESDLTEEYLLAKGANPDFYNLVNPTELALNEWTHCVINTGENSIEIYLNGVLVVSKEREYSEYNNSASEPIYIGNMFNGADGNNNHLNGVLDEFRVYDRPLTDLEIKALYLKY